MFGLAVTAVGSFMQGKLQRWLELFMLASIFGIAFLDSGGWLINGAIFLMMG